MTNIIVAFSRPEDARNIKNIIVRNGFRVVAVCNSGAQAVSSLDGLHGGILVSGYRFEDMLYTELRELVPREFAMLLVASARRVGDALPEGVTWLPMPLMVHDLLEALMRLDEEQSRRKRISRQKPAVRGEEDRRVIEQAKELLMVRNGMTENEAHRYIQKCSMDSGSTLVETAQKLLSLMGQADRRSG